MSFETQSFEPKPQNIRKFILLLAGGIYVFLLIISIMARVNSSGVDRWNYNDLSTSTSNDTTSTDNSTLTDNSWVPAGYNQWDGTFAWKWEDASNAQCSYSSSICWNVYLVTSQDCPGGVYGEISIFDSNDVQIDYTNDTTGRVYAGNTVKLTFDSFNQDANTAQISKLSCRSF